MNAIRRLDRRVNGQSESALFCIFAVCKAFQTVGQVLWYTEKVHKEQRIRLCFFIRDSNRRGLRETRQMYDNANSRPDGRDMDWTYLGAGISLCPGYLPRRYPS